MKIVMFETEEWERRAYQQLEPAHSVLCLAHALNQDAPPEHLDAQILSPFVYSKLDGPTLSRFPGLKCIATRSTGYDHIDLDYCRAHGVTLCNVPDYGDSTVAEHTFALLLALARHLVRAAEQTKHGNFSQAGLRGFELRGKVLGVIGAGRIGRRVIEIAGGFGMEVLAYDIKPDQELSKRLKFQFADFDKVLSSADILSIHVPASLGTIGLISDAQFARMKPNAVLLNTARGNVVDVAALVRALTSGKIAAAGLDVLPHEPLIREEAQVFRGGSIPEADLKALVADHVLLQLPNVIVTPHIAYNTGAAVGRIALATIANIAAFVAGKPQNCIL